MSAINQFAKKTTKETKEHVCFNDKDGSIAPLVTEIRNLSTEIETLTGRLKDKEATIKDVTLQWFFDSHNSKSDIPSSFRVKGEASDAVLVQVQNKYSQITVDEKNADKIESIRSVLGDGFDDNIETKFSLAIDGNNIPEQNREGFLNALVMVSKVFCHAPVSEQDQADFNEVLEQMVEAGYDNSNGETTNAITAKQTVTPNSGFHTARHTLLTPAKNMKLHGIMPCTVAIKKKGVK
jgi:hypothetical protein